MIGFSLWSVSDLGMRRDKSGSSKRVHVLHVCIVYVPSPCTDHVEDVVTAVFQYLAMIRREGPQKWIFQECAVRDKDRDLSGNFSYQPCISLTCVCIHVGSG